MDQFLADLRAFKLDTSTKMQAYTANRFPAVMADPTLMDEDLVKINSALADLKQMVDSIASLRGYMLKMSHIEKDRV